MPIPSILVNGNAPRPTGTEANSTFALATASVALMLVDTSQIGLVQWVVTAPRGSTCAVASELPARPFSTTVGPFDVVGTYIISATANGDPLQQSQCALTVKTTNRSLRIPGETEFDQWDVDSTFWKAIRDLYLELDGIAGGGVALASGAELPTDIDPAATSTQGIGSKAARADHVHGPFTIAGQAAYDFIARNAGNTAWIRFPKGSDGTVLTVTAGVVDWVTPAAGLALTGTAPTDIVSSATANVGAASTAAKGDHTHGPFTVTGQTSQDLLKFDGTNWSRLAIGTNGHVLTITAGVVGWAAPASTTLAGDATGAAGSNIVEKLTGISNVVKFPAAHTAAEITQAQATSGNGAKVRFSAQTSFGTGVTNGGEALVAGGGKNSTGLKGGVTLALGLTASTEEPWVQVAELTTGQRVLAIGHGSTITTTDAPNGIGDGTLLIKAAGTTQTAAPGAGWCSFQLLADGFYMIDENLNWWMLAARG
jgi:hypothetical protein